jgi:hypothetical protein
MSFNFLLQIKQQLDFAGKAERKICVHLRALNQRNLRETN